MEDPNRGRKIFKGNGRLPHHLFEVKNKHHVFDPESGKFFRIDKLTLEILTLLDKHSMEEIPGLLGSRYSPESINQALAEITNLIKSGFLFAQPRSNGSKPEPRDVRLRVISVTLNVVSSCNLSCVYCWNKGGTYGRKAAEKRMDKETALRAVDIMVESSLEDDELTVDFYGGEPLLNFELLRNTIDYCRKIDEKTKKSFTYKVTTNGTLLTREMTEYFNEAGVSLGISVDGTRKTHGANRPFPDGKSSWAVVKKNIREAMKADNVHVSGRATLMPPDLNMVKATKGLFRLGFYDTEVEFASEPSDAFCPDAKWKIGDRDIEAMKREYLRFAKFYLDYSLYRDEAIDVGLSNNITRVLHEAHRFSPCGAGKNFLCVTEEGDLYPCMGFLGMPAYHLGNVKTGVDMERLKIFRHRMETVIYEASECSDCWARHICAGNCPANNEQYNRDIFKLHKRSCEWLKYQLEVAMWLASELGLKDNSLLKGYEPA